MINIKSLMIQYFGKNRARQLAQWVKNTFVRKTDLENAPVAAAKKLATPRTLWGQSFDGSGNVDGTITINTEKHNRSIVLENESSNIIGQIGNYNSGWSGFGITDKTQQRDLGYIIGSNGTHTNIGIGKVGIGILLPEYKLHVVGDIYATGKVIAQGGIETPVLDNVFIMYHRKSDNYTLMVKPHKWTNLQNNGEFADGVAVVEGGKILIVAPTEATSELTWSSAAVSGGGTTMKDRVTALNDWNGKENTASQISKSTSSAVTDTASYAPGYCNLYSRANANGYGLTAGKWWLPSLGEIMMICANMTKINYALSLISGATQLVEGSYWTSTEYNEQLAWRIRISDCFTSGITKASTTYRVRAVSAFIE